MAIAQRHGLPDIVSRVLAARGVPLDSVGRFLDPKLRDILQDPGILKDMDLGVERLVRAIRDGETIGLLADFDVDGATSAALLSRFLNAAGAQTLLHVPDRIKEGYGPNIVALTSLRERGAGVVVTLDCGIAAIEVLGQAADSGLDVIVVDHHMAEPQLPPAVAVINPNRLDESGPFGSLAAVGVTYLLVIALNRRLRELGWYRERQEPALMNWLDLVALGTVCDVVPLAGLNRALVTQGLKALGGRRNAGLRALGELVKLDQRPDSYHLGFILGPRVNAAGRVGKADLGARLLITEDMDEARRIAGELDRYNGQRKAIEAGVMDAAMRAAEDAMDDAPVVVVSGDGWHPGVIGIVAGRLRERFNRPACVITLNGAIGKGSGRSVPGLAIGAAIIAACQSDLLVAGGGHAMAAGFTIERHQVGKFREFLADRFASEADHGPLVPSIGVDGMLAPGGVRRDLVETLSRLGPFGSGNPEPRFAVSSVHVSKAQMAGVNHVNCIFSGVDGGRVRGIAFRAMESDLGPTLLNHGGRCFHLAGRLRPDDWQGRRDVRLYIDDVAVAD